MSRKRKGKSKKALEVESFDTELDASRQTIVAALKEFFDYEKAVSYEKSIFQMARNISTTESDNTSEGLDSPSEGSDIVDVEIYKRVAYQKVGELVSLNPGRPTIEEVSTPNDKLKRATIAVEMLDDASTNVWVSPAYDEYKNKYYTSLDRSQQKPKAVKGVHKCKVKGCGSDEFYTWSAQTRGGDEGMTHYRQCARCGKRDREH